MALWTSKPNQGNKVGFDTLAINS